MTTLPPRDLLRREFDAVVIDLDQSRTKPMLTTDFYRCIGDSVFDAGYRAVQDFDTHYNHPDFDGLSMISVLNGVGCALFDCLVGVNRSPRRGRACRRARGRQGRFAPLKRWPEDGPSLTTAVRDGTECSAGRDEGMVSPVEPRDGGRGKTTSDYRFRDVVERAGSGRGKFARWLERRDVSDVGQAIALF